MKLNYKLIYLSVYLRVAYRCTRALTYCIMYHAGAYYISVYGYARPRSLPTAGLLSPLYAKALCDAAVLSLPVAERCSLEGEHSRSPCTEYVKRLFSSIRESRIASLIGTAREM